MPGVEAGEIGPKVHGGMAAVDNGCSSLISHNPIPRKLDSKLHPDIDRNAGARFTHVKLPLDRMLSRFAKIDEQGKYVKPPHSKLSYGGMIFIRASVFSYPARCESRKIDGLIELGK